MDDLISRQWLMGCVNEGWIKFDLERDENRFIHLVRDIAHPQNAKALFSITVRYIGIIVRIAVQEWRLTYERTIRN